MFLRGLQRRLRVSFNYLVCGYPGRLSMALQPPNIHVKFYVPTYLMVLTSNMFAIRSRNLFGHECPLIIGANVTDL